uniref:Scavenger receptor class F member 1-like n=1 Tax=Crassostrea virginica TaxID=6565 RepID=A0A8B8BEP5_CRAVI|nr:scavenger receptor class F member 1-like [Crassostrea virginica]
MHLAVKAFICFLCVTDGSDLPTSCNPGFYGDDCKIPCPVNCLEHVCDVSGGTCGNCSHGWTGSFCDIPCPTGTYGIDCSLACVGHCKGGCNLVTGKCDRGCDAGWFSDSCNTLLPNGRYGLGCKFECGWCRDGMACHHATGRCMNDCKPGYTGDNCKKECPNGSYGEKCRKSCGKDARCNPKTGECCGCIELNNQVNENVKRLNHWRDVAIVLAVFFPLSFILNILLCIKFRRE